MFKKILIASDHAGFLLKKPLMESLKNILWTDFGTDTESSVDYPDFAKKLVLAMKDDPETSRGVLICGSGQGMAIMANRYKYIRAALCMNAETARLARAHNNANVLCLGARFVDTKTAQEIVQVFLETPFEGGRHEQRVAKLSKE